MVNGVAGGGGGGKWEDGVCGAARRRRTSRYYRPAGLPEEEGLAPGPLLPADYPDDLTTDYADNPDGILAVNLRVIHEGAARALLYRLPNIFCLYVLNNPTNRS